MSMGRDQGGTPVAGHCRNQRRCSRELRNGFGNLQGLIEKWMVVKVLVAPMGTLHGLPPFRCGKQPLTRRRLRSLFQFWFVSIYMGGASSVHQAPTRHNQGLGVLAWYTSSPMSRTSLPTTPPPDKGERHGHPLLTPWRSMCHHGGKLSVIRTAPSPPTPES